MNWLDKIKLIIHILRWRLSWSRRKLDYRPAGVDSPKFISAREAAQLIPDEARVFSSGIAGNARCSVFFYAIRDRFEKSGHPRGLTWINGGAQGSRGRVPGTIEELGYPGLMKSYIAAHMETAKAQLKLGEAGQLDLYTLPQGIISLLLEAQGKGEQTLKSQVGLRTFLDPRVGTGAAVNETASRQLIKAEEEHLVYTMPQPDIALFSAPYADSEGNIYFKQAATLTENIPSIHSVRKHGGKVMAAVSAIIPREAENISVPAHQVDYIVVNPYNEQTVSIPQRRYWPMFAAGNEGDMHRAVQQLKFINTFLKITPVRTAVGNMMARLGAAIFTQAATLGGIINIGVGFPEEVVRLLVEHELAHDYVFTTEAGSYGGLPAPGIFFGAAIYPEHLEPSSVMFQRYHEELDTGVLGFLEVDSRGNVNVSKRGPRVTDYVGPGGFPDIVFGAHNIIFIGSWMHNAEFGIEEGKVKLLKPGKPKFLEMVREITFNGREALKQGKRVFYVTEVGYFQLKPEGLTLMARFPGIDIERDILANATAEIYIPKDKAVPVIDSAVVDGRGFDPVVKSSALIILNG